MTKQVDLTTLSGWADLADGEHTITIKAKADGYRDSELSTGVKVNKAAGQIWKLNNIVDTSGGEEFSISFTNSGISYIGLRFDANADRVYFKTSSQSEIMTYSKQAWMDEGYQIIEVDTTSTEYSSFVNWAKNNGGVLLEAGDYKWTDIPKNILYLYYKKYYDQNYGYQLDFKSRNTAFSSLAYDFYRTNSIATYAVELGDTVNVGGYNGESFIFYYESYRIITIEKNQYVNFDFYNYAIIGQQLIKQQPETWVLNETVNISGTNIYNGIQMTYSGQTRVYPIRSLKMYEYSDGPAQAVKISAQEYEEYVDGATDDTLYTTGGGANGWASDGKTSYNIWTFSVAPTGDLLTWLQANAVKQ